ncbi:MAG TPA: acyltransferase [Puia sp.]
MASTPLAHRNNFDFLRLYFAASVIITHSYSLTHTPEWDNDWMALLTKHQATFSWFGVRGFFIISGYLIYQSLRRSRNPLDYFWKRMLRIYPALLVMLGMVYLLGGIVYPGGYHAYWGNPSAKNFVLHNLNLFYNDQQYGIEGIFPDNPIAGVVNGSIWTIPYEFFFYICLMVLFLMRRKWDKYLAIFGFLLLLNLYFFKEIQPWKVVNLDSGYIIELGLFFMGGTALATMNIENYYHKNKLFFFSVIFMVLCIYYKNFSVFVFLFLPLVVILFGQYATPFLRSIGSRFGDVSYGVYIYGYPIQQTLLHYFKLNYLSLMIWSLVLSIVAGYISWHVVEKTAMKFKKFHFSIGGLFRKVRTKLVPARVTEQQEVEG